MTEKYYVRYYGGSESMAGDRDVILTGKEALERFLCSCHPTDIKGVWKCVPINPTPIKKTQTIITGYDIPD